MNKQRNPVGWFEIYVTDMDRSRKFYETVFGVELQSLPSPDETLEMWMFPGEPGNGGASGAICKMEGCTPEGGNGTVVYFSCRDCAEEESRVAAAGGTLRRLPA